MKALTSVLTKSMESQTARATIPRRFIQTWKTSNLPLFNRAAVANIKLLHPDFEYCFFDNKQVADFIAREFPEYQSVFDGFPLPIQRYDFFRYLAVYRLGGFYLDLDVFLARDLSPLLEFGCVFPFEELTVSAYLRDAGLDWELGQFAFGAAPGHPFMKALIENCAKGQRDPAWALQTISNIPAPFRGQFVAPHTTGPGMVSRTFAESAELRKTVTVLFPKDVCDERHWHNFGDYGVHLMDGSWRKSDGFIRARLARFWENRLRAFLLPGSQQAGPLRPGEWNSQIATSS
jgi:hypothetical protein